MSVHRRGVCAILYSEGDSLSDQRIPLRDLPRKSFKGEGLAPVGAYVIPLENPPIRGSVRLGHTFPDALGSCVRWRAGGTSANWGLG